MANRAALRELHTRLAARLQNARAQGQAMQWLAVEIGAGRFLVPLAQAGEIFPWTSVQTTPYTQDWFLGVSNLRGSLCGVADMAAFMGLATPAGALERDRSECSLLTFNTSLELNCAILVDRLAGLRGPEAFTASQVVPVESDKPYLGLQRSDTSGQLWQELNLLTLSQFPSFLSISA